MNTLWKKVVPKVSTPIRTHPYETPYFPSSLHPSLTRIQQRGNAHHIPVLLNEVLSFLKPTQGGIYCDATFGAGGYTKSILGKINDYYY